MSSSPHSTITSSKFDMENAFSSMNVYNYTSASSATSRSTSFNSLEDSIDGMIPPTFSLFHNNPYSKDVQSFYAKESLIPPPDPITPPAILTSSPILSPSLLFDPRYFFVPEELLPPKKQIHPPSSSLTTLSNSSRKQACILASPSVSTYTPTSPQIYELGKNSIKMHEYAFLVRTCFKIHTMIFNITKVPPKRMSTSEASVLTHATIKKLFAHNVATVLEAQAAMMASTNNPNSKPRKTSVARKCAYKKFTSYQLFYFNGTDGALGLIRWFKWTELIFSHSKYAEKNKVRFVVSTLTKEALFWWNSFTQSIRIEEAYKIT
ncbi:hypothetical protein Tco_1524796 [Tanacetum coccineum]